MIIINGIQYNSNKIILNLEQNSKIDISSSAYYVSWDLVQSPTKADGSMVVFGGSGLKRSTLNPEYIDLNIIGTYYIRAIERAINGNYVETQIFVRVNDINLGVSLPFIGENNQIDKQGWGKGLLEFLLQLLNYSNVKSLICYCEEELNIKDLVYVSGVYDANKMLLKIKKLNDYTSSTDSIIGIITNKEKVSEFAPVIDSFKYNVLFFGADKVNENFYISTDLDNKFYYNRESKTLTNNPFDFYVGKFYNVSKLIIIENYIHVFPAIFDGGEI